MIRRPNSPRTNRQTLDLAYMLRDVVAPAKGQAIVHNIKATPYFSCHVTAIVTVLKLET